jgi:hypothetical protein
MLWCLANSCAAFEVFANASAFSLNILRSGDEAVAQFSRRAIASFRPIRSARWRQARLFWLPPSPASTAACACDNQWVTMKLFTAMSSLSRRSRR